MTDCLKSSAAFFLASFLLLIVTLVTSCEPRSSESTSSVISSTPVAFVGIESPEPGEVHRLLVRQGEVVENNAPLLEILVGRAEDISPTLRPPSQTSVNQSAGVRVQSAEDEARAARAEAVRGESEVQRLTPLVAAGQASQGELDGARDRYERAQQRLQRAEQIAAEGVVAARQSTVRRGEEKSGRLITVRANSAGTIKDLFVRTGDRVTAGQSLGTITPSSR